MDYKIISVESRKGGVGKTTAALNLSRLLLDKGYAVLFIDIDITGTNVTDILDSTYWIEKTNSINYEGKSANLLEIYQHSYMCGKQLPKWRIIDYNNKEAFSIDINKINIIGSQIYKESKDPSYDKLSKLICNPSILFDELHTFWFVEFLQTLCNSFTKEIKNATEKDKEIAIVLDNSPGYVGINPSIQDWLTDIGPIRGKFLTISSLDRQDLISCGNSMDELNAIFSNKYNIAKKYFNAKKDSSISLNLKKEEEKFFIKLASNNINNDIKYYCDIESLYKDDNNYNDNPGKYLALLINKVPTELKLPLFQFNFNKIWEDKKLPETIGKILKYNNFKNQFVFYDEYINFQYNANLISKGNKSRMEYPQKGLIKYFDKIKSSFLKRKNLNELKKSENEYIKGIQNYEFILNNLNSYQKTLEELIERLKNYNFQNIIRLIDKEWHPITPIERLRQYFVEIAYRSDFTLMDIESNVDENNFIKSNKNLQLLLRRIDERFSDGKFISYTFEDFENNYSNNAVVYLTLIPYVNMNLILNDELFEIFVLIRKIQQERFNKKNELNLRKNNFKVFLIKEHITENEIGKYEEMYFLRRYDLKTDLKYSFIAEFYNSFCQAQVRVLDLDNDFDFLIDILRKVTLENTNKIEDNMIFPNIRDILNNVIIEKSISHSIAREVAEKGFRNANYMTEFQNKLKEIINNWRV